MNIKNPNNIATGNSGLSLCLTIVLSFFCVVAEGAKSVYIGEEVQFTNEIKGPGEMKLDWDFGDGEKSAKTAPSHVYKKPGKYTATLTVDVPNVGKIASNQLVIEVKPITAEPDVDSEEPYIGQTVKFTHKTDGPKGLKWKWNFGDSGDPIETDKQEPISHLYKKPGKKQALLTVNVPNVGEQKLGELELTVKEVVAAPGPQSVKVKAGDEVTFTNNTEGPEGSMDWDWDFGDGEKSTEKAPSHTYKKQGEYKVTLTVRLKDGDGNVIDGIEPITESIDITVDPNHVQPHVVNITAGRPKLKDGGLVLPVTVEVNGTYEVVQLRVDNQKKVLFEENQTFNVVNKDKYIFTVPIKGLKGDPSLFPSPADKTLTANATVFANAPDSFGHLVKDKEETLSFKVTPDRSGLFWVLLGSILVLILVVVVYMWWWGKQPRIEGRLQDMNGKGKIDLYDYKKKRDIDLDLGDVSPKMAGHTIHFKFRGRRMDPDKQLSVLTSNFEVNDKSYTMGEFCDVANTVIIKIGDHKFQYRP